MRRVHFFHYLLYLRILVTWYRADLALFIHFELTQTPKTDLMQNFLQIRRYAISRTAEEALCCATSSRLSIPFLLIQEYLSAINPYLNKFTVPCAGNGKGCAACTAVKTRWRQGCLPQRCSFLTVSCHLSAQDRPQLIPTELWLSQASSKSLQAPALCIHIRTTSKQPAAHATHGETSLLEHG